MKKSDLIYLDHILQSLIKALEYLDGVWKYDGTLITHYSIMDQSEQIALFSIYEDNKGDLWLGTHNNGAYKFNGVTFEHFKPLHHKN